jgi:hypothetical protein
MLLKNLLHPFLEKADFSVTLLPCTKLYDVTFRKIMLLLLSNGGVLQPKPKLISKVLKVTVHYLRQKRKGNFRQNIVFFFAFEVSCCCAESSICLSVAGVSL